MLKISDLIQSFVMSNAKRAVWFMSTMKADFWEKKGEANALEAFHQAAEEVPAYREFLKEHNVNPSDIDSIGDFRKKVPVMLKKNYLARYPMGEMVQGEMRDNSIGLCFTSGTSGKPTAMLTTKKSFPMVINVVMSIVHYLWEIRSPSKHTFIINAFAQGPWTASFLSNALMIKEAEKSNVTFSVPGSDPTMIAESVERVAGHYDQIVIIGYPTVLKSFIDEADKRGLDLSRIDIKILSAGEPLPKNVKKLLLSKIAPERNESWRILDFFATTDISVLGLGLPITTAIQEVLEQDKELSLELFGVEELPNLFQYNPMTLFAEEVEGDLIATKTGIMPVIRYKIGDLCKVVKFKTVEEALVRRGYNLDEILKKSGWHKGYFEWPFVTHLGRSDDMIIIYSGANVYARNLYDLLEREETEDVMNFRLTTELDETHNVRLMVYLQLKPGMSLSLEEVASMEDKCQKLVHEELMDNNIDYKDAYGLNPDVVYPIVKVFGFAQGPFEKDASKPKHKMVA